MNVFDLFEDAQELTGYINAQALAQMLPAITSVRDFDNAVDKLRLGQDDHLILQEKMQLALAFISLLRADGPHKQQIVRNLMSIQAPNQTARQQALQPAQVVPQGQQQSTQAQPTPR